MASRSIALFQSLVGQLEPTRDFQLKFSLELFSYWTTNIRPSSLELVCTVSQLAPLQQNNNVLESAFCFFLSYAPGYDTGMISQKNYFTEMHQKRASTVFMLSMQRDSPSSKARHVVLIIRLNATLI